MSAVSGAQRFPVIRAKADERLATRPEDAEVDAWTRAMVRGEESAWVNFHREYSGRIHRYLLVLFKGNEEMAAEVLQETFARIARHMRTFSEETVLWGWITRLARTAAIDELRKKGRREESVRELAEEFVPGEAQPDKWSDLLNRALEQLDLRERELLERKYLAGESVREIATSGNDSEKAVESRITRARVKLRALMIQFLQREE